MTLASQSLTCARPKMSSICGLMHIMQRYLSAQLLVTLCMKGGYPLGKRRKTSKSRMTSGLLVFGDADDGMTNTSSSRIYNTLNCFAIKYLMMPSERSQPCAVSGRDQGRAGRLQGAQWRLKTKSGIEPALLCCWNHGMSIKHSRAGLMGVDLAQRCTD